MGGDTVRPGRDCSLRVMLCPFLQILSFIRSFRVSFRACTVAKALLLVSYLDSHLMLIFQSLPSLVSVGEKGQLDQCNNYLEAVGKSQYPNLYYVNDVKVILSHSRKSLVFLIATSWAIHHGRCEGPTVSGMFFITLAPLPLK